MPNTESHYDRLIADLRRGAYYQHGLSAEEKKYLETFGLEDLSRKAFKLLSDDTREAFEKNKVRPHQFRAVVEALTDEFEQELIERNRFDLAYGAYRAGKISGPVLLHILEEVKAKKSKAFIKNSITLSNRHVSATRGSMKNDPLLEELFPYLSLETLSDTLETENQEYLDKVIARVTQEYLTLGYQSLARFGTKVITTVPPGTTTRRYRLAVQKIRSRLSSTPGVFSTAHLYPQMLDWWLDPESCPHDNTEITALKIVWKDDPRASQWNVPDFSVTPEDTAAFEDWIRALCALQDLKAGFSGIKLSLSGEVLIKTLQRFKEISRPTFDLLWKSIELKKINLTDATKVDARAVSDVLMEMSQSSLHAYPQLMLHKYPELIELFPVSVVRRWNVSPTYCFSAMFKASGGRPETANVLLSNYTGTFGDLLKSLEQLRL